MANPNLSTALLSTTYFGPIQWYQKLNRYDLCVIEQFDNFQKQTYRNRCRIATANGSQVLTVPVERTEGKCLMRDVRISDHGAWRHLHWNALQSAYGESPFFEFYADDLHPFFERRWTFLLDFNMDITNKLCELLDIHPRLSLTTNYLPPTSGEEEKSFRKEEKTLGEEEKSFGKEEKKLGEQEKSFGKGEKKLGEDEKSREEKEPFIDFREAIHPKHPLPDADFAPRPYYQQHAPRHGFQPNLSILDLLFNEGNEAIFFL